MKALTLNSIFQIDLILWMCALTLVFVYNERPPQNSIVESLTMSCERQGDMMIGNRVYSCELASVDGFTPDYYAIVRKNEEKLIRCSARLAELGEDVP